MNDFNAHSAINPEKRIKPNFKTSASLLLPLLPHNEAMLKDRHFLLYLHWRHTEGVMQTATEIKTITILCVDKMPKQPVVITTA